MAGVMDTIKARLGLGKPVTPQDAANAAADKFGGGIESVVKAKRGRQAQIDAEMDKQLGMPPPKGQK